jgi:hypothetical protein
MQTVKCSGLGWTVAVVAAALMVLLPVRIASAQSITLSGTATQGTGMSAATVTAYAVNPADGSNGATLGSSPTDSNGNFSITMDSAPDGPVRLLATGGTFTSVQDGTTITSRNLISVLLADVTGSMSGISLNPLTKFVNNMTVGMLTHPNGPTLNFATALANATSAIEADYGLATDPSTILPDYTAAGIGTDAGNLGLILGGLINLDQHLTPPTCKPGGLVSVLAGDIADGVYDGASFGTPLTYCGVPLPAIAGISDFQDALSGLQQLKLITQGFVFGGTANILASNGITPTQLLPALATINTAIAVAAPPSVNEFAAPSGDATMKHGYVQTTATLLTNGRLLVAGGYGPNGFGPASTTEIYIPSRNIFVAGPQMKVARISPVATRLQNRKVLIAGGLGKLPSGVINGIQTTEIYDPVTNSFAQDAPSMSTARNSATATLLTDGRVLIAGGRDSAGNILASTDIYDATTNSFVASPPSMFSAHNSGMAALLPNGKVLIAGGSDSTGQATAATELFDPSTNSFTEGPLMNHPRAAATATLLPNNKVLIAGGPKNLLESSDPTSTDIYDVATNSFAASTPSLNEARLEAAQVLLPANKAFLVGGDVGLSVPLGSTELYDPISNTFAASPPALRGPRDFPCANLLPNGQVIVVGGGTLNNNGLFNPAMQVELYTP